MLATFHTNGIEYITNGRKTEIELFGSFELL